MSDSLIRVPPFYYIHVLDNNKNVQRIETGPQTFTRQDHEKIVLPPTPMVVIPPRHYCIIKDPYIRKEEGTKEPVTDDFGQVKLRHGDSEIRFAEEWGQPFPLLPGESKEGIKPLDVVDADTALRLRAERDLIDEKGEAIHAGDEWLFAGPATYRPKVEVRVVEKVRAMVVAEDHALRLQARKAMVDRNGVQRKAGEEWLVRETGAYLPAVDESVVGIVKPHNLVQTRALHLLASDTFTDVYGKVRKAGQEWLVTFQDSELHLPDVHEQVIGQVNMTVLNKLQWCVVVDPVNPDTGKNSYGSKQLRVGPDSFFLLPGESLQGGKPQNTFVLANNEALLLKATESHVGEDGEERRPGDLWMIHGPLSYIPPVTVEIVEKRRSIPLDTNEGIYVRDIKTGAVRSVCGQTYMLKAHEELWAKELPEEVEQLLTWSFHPDNAPKQARNKTRVVTYRVPHNACVQIYDYKVKKSRVVFGPGLVLLDPEEQFTVVSLSGDTPKRPNVIKTLSLMLGPDFMTDVIEVETSDHARLRLQLRYNWQFEVDHGNQEHGSQIFQVRDFVGDACKAIASRVRGAAASYRFDQFHKKSAHLIRSAVFGVDAETGKVGNKFIFNANRLVITNIDIHTVEPVDERTRESLQKSVQLAIEITTKKQERNARHEAEKIEQDARSLIDRQKIENQKGQEKERQVLIELQAASKAIETSGSVKAEAKGRAQQLEIEGASAVEQARLSAQASNIEAKAALEEAAATQEAELSHKKALALLQVSKAGELASIESEKFKSLVKTITPNTIKAIAQAGPELQASLLQGLGLKGYLMTDGNSPINLFNAAKGMVAPGMPPM